MERDPLIGKQIGAYLIQSLIGEGGMARVYKASHTRLRRDAAIKVILSHIAEQSDFRARFEREAQLIASLQHQNIVAIYDFGEEGNITYLAMQYVGGGTLRSKLHDQQPISPMLAVQYAIQMARALHHAHLRGIVHRDVKPLNILLSASDANHLLLTDFGIAKLFDLRQEVTWTEADLKGAGNSTGVGMVGTPSYMAPEQVIGNPVDARTDVYALGLVLFEMLTGKSPFETKTIIDIMYQQVNVLPARVNIVNPAVPELLAQVVRQALEKAPDARFQSAKALEEALSNVMNFMMADPQKTLPTRCFNCGAVPGLDDRFCPNCGNDLLLNKSAYEQTLRSAHEQMPFQGTQINVGNSPSIPSVSHLPTIYNLDNAIKLPEKTDAHNVYKCPHCTSEVRPGDVFCLNCGYHQSPVAPVIEQDQAGTIGTRLVEAFEGQLHTGTVENASSTHDQSVLTNPESFTTDASAPSQSSRPLDATAALDQTLAQLFEEGDAHYTARRYKEALLIYNHIIQLDPSSAVAYGKKGNALGKLKKYKEAHTAYDAALALESNHASIHSADGDVLYRLKRYVDAVAAYDAALSLNPKDVLVWTARGNALYKLRRGEDALEAYDRAIGLNANYDVIWIKAKVLFEQGRHEESLAAYEHALNYAPKKSGLWDGKGEVLYKLNHYDEALEAHNRALALDPYNTSISSKCDRLRDLIKHLQAKASQPQTPIEDRASSPGYQVSVQTREDRSVYTEMQSVSSHDETRDRDNPPDSVVEENQASQVEKQPLEGVGPTTYEDDSTSRVWQIKKDRTESASSTTYNNDSTRKVEYFDVFLSYSHVDLAWVEDLAKRLEDEHHFRVWLDKWVLVPGQPWQQAIAHGIDCARCCVVCISAQTPKGWCTREIQRALSRQVHNPSFGVIPVLLPDAKNVNVDEFLDLNTWVDFRRPNHAYELHRLACGVKGIPPGRWPPGEQTTTRIDPIVDEMLNDLQRLDKTGLITDSVKEEYIRITMEKVWFAKWTLQTKDRTDE